MIHRAASARFKVARTGSPLSINLRTLSRTALFSQKNRNIFTQPIMGSVLGIISEETPKHTVVHTANMYNIRRYEPFVIAECPSSGVRGQEGDAFRALAKYIGVFGNPANEGKQAMAMTAPVIMREGQAKGEKMAMTAPVFMKQEGNEQACAAYMSFTLPSKYTEESAPKPTNPLVQLRTIPGRTCAVHTYTGRTSISDASSKAQWFIKHLTEEGYTPSPGAKWDLAQYNPPWTLPFMRTNEIHVPVQAGPMGVKV